MSTAQAPERERPAAAHDRRGLPAAAGGVPGHLDLEDPLPRGPGAADAAAHAGRLPALQRGGRRAAGDDPAAPAGRVPAAARDPPGARVAVRAGQGAAPPARGRARRRRGRARPRRALRARGDRARARAGARGVRPARCTSGRDARSAIRRADADIAAACAKLSRYGIVRAPPAHVPHRRRPRGGAARSSSSRPRCARATPSGGRPGIEELQTLAELAQELSQLLFWRDLRQRSRAGDGSTCKAKIREVPDFPAAGRRLQGHHAAARRPGGAARRRSDLLAGWGERAEARPRARRRGARLHPRRARSPARSAAASSPPAGPGSCRRRR